MAKKAKRRAWTAADVRTLKAAAKKKTRAPSIARSLKRTEGATQQEAVSAWGCLSILEADAGSVRIRISPAEVRGFHFCGTAAGATAPTPFKTKPLNVGGSEGQPEEGTLRESDPDEDNPETRCRSRTSRPSSSPRCWWPSTRSPIPSNAFADSRTKTSTTSGPTKSLSPAQERKYKKRDRLSTTAAKIAAVLPVIIKLYLMN